MNNLNWLTLSARLSALFRLRGGDAQIVGSVYYNGHGGDLDIMATLPCADDLASITDELVALGFEDRGMRSYVGEHDYRWTAARFRAGSVELKVTDREAFLLCTTAYAQTATLQPEEFSALRREHGSLGAYRLLGVPIMVAAKETAA